MFLSCQFNSVYQKINNIIIIDENYNKNIPPLQSGRLDITTLRKLPGGTQNFLSTVVRAILELSWLGVFEKLPIHTTHLSPKG
jgi:hypothetical protein